MKGSIPIQWRLNGQRYRLVGAQCRDCGHKMISQRDVCPACTERVPAIFFTVAQVAPARLRAPIPHPEAA